MNNTSGAQTTPAGALFGSELWTNRLIMSAAMGPALHHLVFRKGEWHLWAPQVFMAWILSYPLLLSIELRLRSGNLADSAWSTFLTMGCFTTAIFSSIAISRLLFHPLDEFPGPKFAAVSKLWHAAKCFDGRNHLILEKLRRQYGDFVRTGPNEITVFNPEGLVLLDSPGSRTTRSVWYDFLVPLVGILPTRDESFHDQRRKVWTPAFSGKVLPVYEQQMADHAERLEELVRSAAEEGSPICWSSLAYWFSFDVMGMFALSTSFNMLHGRGWHNSVSGLRNALMLLAPMSPVPWLARIGFFFCKGFWRVKDWNTMILWCADRMTERIQVNEESTDIASYIIADARKKGTLEKDHNLFAGEAIGAIIAGSDTVALTLVFLFYELALNPAQADRLYEELSGVDVRDRRALEKLPHLNALIKETMRLHPAVPTSGYRDTPPEGMTIGGRFIPGNTTVVAPRYSVFRSETCYARPNEFIPQRWYSEPELVKDSRSFLPFAQGRYTCLGKQLALSELRTVTALLVSRYDIGFAGSDKGSHVEADQRDNFTAVPGELNLLFMKREKQGI